MGINSKVALVVATNRPNSLKEFLAAWRLAKWDEVHIVCDETEVFQNVWAEDGDIPGPNVFGYCWKDIAKLSDSGKIFSRQDAGIKSFGFLMAYKAGAQTIICLDDDCYPDGDPEKFVEGHLANLYKGFTRERSTIQGLRVRGLPYYAKCQSINNVAVSMGTWSGVPDLDAVSSIAHGVPTDFAPPDNVKLCDPDCLYPMSGMNLAFKAWALPLMFFPKMGLASPYRRFDDIWAGLFAQAALRLTGRRMCYGTPVVHHSRASEPLKNLVAEAPGLSMNEALWELFGDAALKLPIITHETLPQVISRLQAELRDRRNAVPDPDYLVKWMDAINVWQGLIDS